MFKYLGALLIVGVGFALGFYTKDWTTPEPQWPDPDTIRVETSEPDTSWDAWLPDVVVLHDTVEELRVDSFYVPLNMNVGGIVSETPIRRRERFFGPDELIFTQFDPSTRSYVQERYTFEPPQWSIWPELEGTVDGVGARMTPAIGFRYRKITVTGGYSVWFSRPNSISISLSIKPFSFP